MNFDCQGHNYNISAEFCEENKNNLSTLDLGTNSLYGHSWVFHMHGGKANKERLFSQMRITHLAHKKRISFSFSFAHNRCLVWLNKYKSSMDHHRQKSYALLIWQFKVIGSYFFRTSLDNAPIRSTWVLLHEFKVNIML